MEAEFTARPDFQTLVQDFVQGIARNTRIPPRSPTPDLENQGASQSASQQENDDAPLSPPPTIRDAQPLRTTTQTDPALVELEATLPTAPPDPVPTAESLTIIHTAGTGH